MGTWVRLELHALASRVKKNKHSPNVVVLGFFTSFFPLHGYGRDHAWLIKGV